MSASNIVVVIVALALGVTILECGKGDAIKCWEKDSKHGAAKKVDCPETKKFQLSNYKVELKVDACLFGKANDNWYVSGCSSEQLCKSGLRVPVSKDCSDFTKRVKIKKGRYRGEYAEFCCCTTDSCNGAPFDRPVPWLLSLFVAVVIAANYYD